MTRSELKNVIDELASLADAWNDATADEDRGCGHDALCLVVFSDGSGRLCRQSWAMPHDIEEVHGFNNPEELAKILQEEEYVEFGADE